jgi:hypothetical protein
MRPNQTIKIVRYNSPKGPEVLEGCRKDGKIHSLKKTGSSLKGIRRRIQHEQ